MTLAQARTQLEAALADYMEACGIPPEEVTIKDLEKLEELINGYVVTSERPQ